jgi:hypothetical protein
MPGAPRRLRRVGGTHAKLVFLLPRPEAPGAAIDDEGGDALLAPGFVGDRHDHGHIGEAAVGDERLRAVEDPGVPVLHRGGPGTAGIRPGAVLGETPRAHELAGGELGQVLLLLFFGAGEENVARGKRVVGGGGKRHPRVHAGQFLDHDRVVDGRHAGPAVFLGKHHREQAKFAEFGEDLAREFLLLIPFAGMRLEFLQGEVANGFPEEPLISAELKVHLMPLKNTPEPGGSDLS